MMCKEARKEFRFCFHRIKYVVYNPILLGSCVRMIQKIKTYLVSIIIIIIIIQDTV
jgi:hypothetical protein